MPDDVPSRRPRRLARMVFLLLPLAFVAGGGCGWRKGHVPSAGQGREALEAALTAWQNGKPAGAIDSTSPPVQAVDTGWARGQKLAGYEILDEVTREDGRRCFKVRLHLRKPAGTREANYLVLGESPLWVYREEDYNKGQGWGGYK